MTSSLLTLHGAAYSKHGRALVEPLDLAAESGALTIVVGPNGAGKSTVLRLMSGEIAPSEGEVRLAGVPLTHIPAWRLACQRAIMSQQSSLAFPFTAFEVARLGAEGIGRGMSSRDRDRLTGEALARADVLPLAGRLFQTLSGGEQQRVHFARVLAQLAAGRTITDRQVLLLDEPIASLDLKHQLTLLGEARALAREGLAVVAVLHDLQLAASLADRLVVLCRGRLVAQGTPEAILSPHLIGSVFEVHLAAPQLPAVPWLLEARPASPAQA